ncbi:MAG: phycobilisome protein [Synechococcales cyanobacterium RU_4_20]|nr:phycobilisome protein [Synechococcales cyanobacterium RU_4_20]
MTFQLSDRAKQLIPLARIVNLAKLGVGAGAIARIQAADDESRYLTNEDLVELGSENSHLGWNLECVRYLRENAEAIVTDARSAVLAAYPDITETGGDLHPASRAEACWRDFWHFLRCITYGIASGTPAFTSADGLSYMEQLYQELKVPLPAMVTGLEALKAESLQRLSLKQLSQKGLVSQVNEAEEISLDIAPYFDHLIGELRSFG